MEIALGLVAVVVVAALVWQLFKLRGKLEFYSSIDDVETHRVRVQAENAKADQKLASVKAAVSSTAAQLDKLKTDLGIAESTKNLAQRVEELKMEAAAGQRHVDGLRAEYASIEEAIGLQTFGFYETRYGLESSAEYTARLKRVRADQKLAVKNETASHLPDTWTVDGSAAKGRKMVKEHSKLMLRAFNGECDAAVAKVKYSNVTSLQTRIEKSFTAINKLGKTKHIWIQRIYLELKLAELHLVHEHREKVQEEKEEQRRIKDQMREEQKALKEIEKVEADAARDEKKAVTALEKARRELEAASGVQNKRMQALVHKLETQLKDALERKARAMARAQLTKSGHVYIISNIGSFGEGIYKIGMTRRLEPLDRVKELGDASVPFRFDVHAMIYAENAPTLEKALHQEFADRRVNMVNHRKEYFRVSLDDIREAVSRHHGIITFVTVPEAEEYRKTVSMLEAPSAR